jgi:DNA-binding transcriptional ArsR family regulator
MLGEIEHGEDQMQPEPDLSVIAGLIGDPTRAIILSALLSGQSLPASELAYRAHITPQTASEHLSRLVEGGLLDVSRTGRHRYYRLKNAEVARALEALAAISPAPRVRTQPQSADYHALCFARSCYDHLAGKLGVALTHALLDKGYLVADEQSFTLTEAGSGWLAGWSIDESQLRNGRRLFARACLDWSERENHLAGGLGAAVLSHLLADGWVARVPGGRTLRLTEAGRAGFQREFGIDRKQLKVES